jgi:hypothetical protein
MRLGVRALDLAPVLATLVLRAGTASLAPRSGEPGPLRWARTASAHPARTLLALFLLWLAVRPRPSANGRNELPNGRSGLVSGDELR